MCLRLAPSPEIWRGGEEICALRRMIVEAPFRFPIRDFTDVERLLTALAKSPLLVPGSLHLIEGADLLARQLAEEQRGSRVLPGQARTPAGLIALFRTLWTHPLTAQRPRFLRLEASLSADPALSLSLRLDAPTVDALPRWVDLEGSRDPAVLARLLAVYRAVGQDAGLTLQEV